MGEGRGSDEVRRLELALSDSMTISLSARVISTHIRTTRRIVQTNFHASTVLQEIFQSYLPTVFGPTVYKEYSIPEYS